MRTLFNFTILLFVLFSILACGRTWQVPDANRSDVDSATIVSFDSWQSPEIKTFEHIDSGFFKMSAGRRSNPAYAADRVETPPGKVKVGVVSRSGSYHPTVAFNALPSKTYLLTWICIPYPFLAVLDAESHRLLALDSYYLESEALLGESVNESNQCLGYNLHPPWMDIKWWSFETIASDWQKEKYDQSVRILCDAADQGNPDARFRVASILMYEQPHDPILGYVWLRLAADAGEEKAAAMADYMQKNELSPQNQETTLVQLKAWGPGQCVQYFIGTSKQQYPIQIAK